MGQPHPQGANAAKDRGEINYVFSENVANTDYERVMREYSEAGNQLILGEVFGVETRRGRSPRTIPTTAFLMGSSFSPRRPTSRCSTTISRMPSYLTGMVAGGMTNEQYRHGRRLSDPRSQPADARLHGGRREINPDAKFQVAFIGSWFDPPKAKETAFAQIDRAPTCSTPSASASPTPPRSAGSSCDRQRHRHPGRYPETVVAWALWHMEPSIDKAMAAVKAGSFKAEDYGPS